MELLLQLTLRRGRGRLTHMNNNDVAQVLWHDGTTRLVEAGSYILTTTNVLLFVKDADT